MQLHELSADKKEQIMNSFLLLQEAAQYLLAGGMENPSAGQLLNNAEIILIDVLDTVQCVSRESEFFKLLQCMQATVSRIYRHRSDEDFCRKKIRFEWIPMLEEAWMYGRYFLYALTNSEEMDRFLQDVPALAGNKMIDAYEEAGEYPYELSICVIGYNKLEYTSSCIQCLRRYIPKDLKYELILLNHGSSDGTREYFESIGPDKQLDFAVNGGSGYVLYRILEGKYYLFISNDVLITPNAIENMLRCIRSDEQIAMVVPCTSSVSNCQQISMAYGNVGEMLEKAREHNVSNPYLWEQRTRLCNPLMMVRSAIYGSRGIFYSVNGMCMGTMGACAMAFPDDIISLLLRRRGYKMILAKDTYCHHYGSVTLKDEFARQSEIQVYQRGRSNFLRRYGIDPWGLGHCYDEVFYENCVVRESHSHTEILGINCGMGANSLKIKEQLKEFYHNTDCSLTNLTDAENYCEDLAGVSDRVELVRTEKKFRRILQEQKWHYIVWETPFLGKNDFTALLQACMEQLTEDGWLLLKCSEQNRTVFEKSRGKLLGENWRILEKQDWVLKA